MRGTGQAPGRHALMLACAAAGALAIAAAPRVAGAQSPLTIKATELEAVPDPSLAYNGMAKEMGLFAKHGLTLEQGPALGGGGPARVQAVVTDSTDVATSDIISVFGGIYSGADIRVLMVMTPYGDEEVWGQKKFGSLKDAVGQTWGVASLAGAQRFNAQLAAQGLGFAPGAFRWVAISGADAARLEAIETGRTQLGTISHLGAALATAKGYTKDVHVVVEHTAKYTPPVPRLVIVARESWIKSHEDMATRYVETMLDAGRQWRNDGKSWVTPASAIYKNSGLGDQQLETAWKQFRDGGYFSVNGGVNYAATRKLLDLFFKIRGEKPNDHLSKPEDVYDTGPLRKALDKMGVAKGAPDLPDTPDWYGKSG